MSNQNRVSAGVPTGGQFTTSVKSAASGVALGAPTTGFDRGISNRDLAGRLDDIMTTYGTSGEIHGEDGTYPGSVRIQGPYEGELLDLAEEFTRNDLYVNLRDGQDVWGDPEDGFEFTVSDNDRYGNHYTWMSKHDF